MGSALEEVIAERVRQVKTKGWSPEHDDKHTERELSRVAACYALYEEGDRHPRINWPWAWNMFWWKPTTYRHNLVKAAALLIAEIERLDRAVEGFAKKEGPPACRAILIINEGYPPGYCTACRAEVNRECRG